MPENGSDRLDSIRTRLQARQSEKDAREEACWRIEQACQGLDSPEAADDSTDEAGLARKVQALTRLVEDLGSENAMLMQQLGQTPPEGESPARRENRTLPDGITLAGAAALRASVTPDSSAGTETREADPLADLSDRTQAAGSQAAGLTRHGESLSDRIRALSGNRKGEP